MDNLSAVPATGHESRRIAVNSGYLLIAYMVESLLSIVLLGLVARYLDQAGFGRYGYAISFVELFIMITELSSSRVLVREIASDLQNARRVLANVWTLRLVTSTGTILAVALAARMQAVDPQVFWSIVLFAIGQVFYVLADVFNSVFRAHQQMRYQTMTIVLGQVLVVSMCAGSMALGLGLVALFGARAVANFVRMLYAWYLCRKRFIPERLSDDLRGMWFILRESFPVAVYLVLHRLMWRGGIVVMTTQLNREAPGQGDLAAGLLYGPLRLVEQMRVVPSSLVGAILPVFSRQARAEPERFRANLSKSGKLFVTLSVLLALMISILARPITRMVLGGGLEGSAQVLAVFACVIVFTFPNQLIETALMSLGRQSVVAIGLGLGVVVGMAASWLYFVPAYQGMGVAFGIMLAEGITFVVGVAVLLPYLNRREWAAVLAKLALSALATGAVMFGLRDRLWFVLVGLLGLITFGAANLLLRTFTPGELEAIATLVLFPRRLHFIRRWLFRKGSASTPDGA